jgi:[ribosomal protein S18]-alanine N-acetyltransferase
MENLTIAKVELADIPELKTIEIECSLSPWTISAYEDEQRRADSVMLKMQSADGGIVGFIVGRVPAHGEAAIYNIGTKSKYRRQGVGSNLLGQFRNVCVERQMSSIWLEVRVSNRPAIDFYESHGFVSKGLRRNFYSNPMEDAILMALALV